MKELRNCYALRCGYVTDAAVDQCPKCGSRMRTTRFVRRLGWVQLVLGLFLVGLMGTITFFVAPIMLQPGEIDSGSSFTGTPEQVWMILGLFGLVIVFGLGTVLSGLWQIKTGRRNRWIALVMLGLIVLLVLVGSGVRKMLGG